MRLIVLSENFGLNFSGGCIATAKFLETLESAFEEVIILTQKIGIHQLNNAQFITYNNFVEIPSLLKKYKLPNTIGYGDFYIAEYFIEAKIPFYFTYHDNFPEVANYDLFNDSFVQERMMEYQNIFKNAVHIFSVSKTKVPFIKEYTNQVSLVRNGIYQKVEKFKVKVPLKKEKVKILMAGNIDKRKYEKAIGLFTCLNALFNFNFQIDIYGLLNDNHIAKKIASFPFVQLMGYAKYIPFKNYHLYLNTSLAENLSIAVVDAIANYTPVITFDVGGLKEVVNRNNGHIINAFDIELMANQLINLNYKYFAAHFDIGSIKDFDWVKNANKMFMKMLGN